MNQAIVARRFLFAALAVMAALLVSSCGNRDADTLVVGMDLSYPPFETIGPSGKPEGVSVDLAEALGKFLGKPVRIENIPFTGLIPSLKTGKIDCIVSSMTDTAERRASIAFSDAYLSTGLALLIANDSPIHSLQDLDQSGKTLAVRQGTTGEVWARANIANARILSLEKESSAVLEVIQGRADAFLYDQMSVWKNAREHPEKTRALLKPLQKENWAIGLRHSDVELRSQINDFLKSFREGGGFDSLGDKFLRDQKASFKEQGIEFYF